MGGWVRVALPGPIDASVARGRGRGRLGKNEGPMLPTLRVGPPRHCGFCTGLALGEEESNLTLTT